MKILKLFHLSILKSILVSTIFFSVLSCQQDHSELTDQKLAEIIADMHLSEMVIDRQDLKFRDSLSIITIEKLEKIHNISKDQIKKEVELLMEDKSRQSTIYTIAIDILQNIEQGIREKDITKTRSTNEKDG